MVFHDILLSPKYSYGATGGVLFSTDIISTASGFEQRNINWSEPGGAWDIGQELKTQSELDGLIDFFYARQGMAFSFRFLDWTDFTVTNQTLASFPGPINSKVQIVKDYTSASQTTTRTITKPVDVTDANHTLSLTGSGNPSYTTMEIKIGGVTKTEGVEYQIDYDTGEVEDLVGVSATVSVSCSFHAHVRFDSDKQNITIDANDILSWTGIPITLLKQAT